MENCFHAALDHLFFRGCDGRDHCVGVGFVGHVEQQTGRIAKVKVAFVFNRCHGGETLDNISVEFTHTLSTLRVLSLSTDSIAPPDSSQ